MGVGLDDGFTVGRLVKPVGLGGSGGIVDFGEGFTVGGVGVEVGGLGVYGGSVVGIAIDREDPSREREYAQRSQHRDGPSNRVRRVEGHRGWPSY